MLEHSVLILPLSKKDCVLKMGYNNFVVSNKNESDGDGDYKCTLPQKYVKLAATELNETDTLRTKSLQQFREWIVDHPQIKHCRTGTVF